MPHGVQHKDILENLAGRGKQEAREGVSTAEKGVGREGGPRIGSHGLRRRVA